MSSPTAASTPGFKDRSVRLAVFGILAILIGGLSILLGLFHVALLVAGGRIPGAETLPADPRSAVMGLLLYSMLGLAFIWVGIGSMRKRRWVRPLMLILAWTWLLGGVLGLALVPGLLDGMLGARAGGLEPPPDAVVLITKIVVLGMGSAFGVVLPAIFVWVYQDRDLSRTCEAHDTTPVWTERCPVSVLGLSVGLGAVAAMALPLAFRAVVPLFGLLVTGWLGALLLLAGALLSVYLARSTFELRMAGWWGATILLTAIGVSTGITFWHVDPLELYREMGYAEEQLAVLRRANVLTPMKTLVATAILTVLTLAYMVGIRKHFVKGTR